MQPIAVVKRMVVVPARIPDTMPVVGTTPATEGSKLLHEPPPEVVLLRVILLPTHTLWLPEVAISGLTVAIRMMAKITARQGGMTFQVPVLSVWKIAFEVAVIRLARVPGMRSAK